MKHVSGLKEQELRDKFDEMKEKLLMDWKNHYYDQTYQQAFAYFDNVAVNTSYEVKTLREKLEQFAFEDFQRMHQEWLINGRQTWLVSGNMDHQESIDMVEEVSQVLSLKHLKIEDLADVRALAVQEGEALLLQQPLEDASNDNSCVITYFEVGLKGQDIRKKLTHQVVMQYLSEPFFNDLRTQQQLGYVVFSRPCVSPSDLIGAQFMVQSSVRSCEYIVSRINQFLSDQMKRIDNLTDEDFEVQKQAVLVKLAEKDINLQKEHSRHWDEIATHQYTFDRQDLEIAELEKVTKEEFQALFRQTFCSPKSKRIDIELTSDAHQQEQQEYLEANASDPLFANVKRIRVDKPLSAFKREAGYHPDVYKAAFVRHSER